MSGSGKANSSVVPHMPLTDYISVFVFGNISISDRFKSWGEKNDVVLGTVEVREKQNSGDSGITFG